MAILNTVWYVRDNSDNNLAGGGTVGWSSVSQWQALTAYNVGTIVRQVTSPTSGNERCFVCIVAGTTGSTQPTWILTKGAKTVDSTITWMECTGMAAMNGDSTNTPAWASSNTVTLGTIVYNSGTDSYHIVTTAGTTGGSAPAFSATAGSTVADNTVTWTSLGVKSNFTAWGAPFARLRLAFGTSWAAIGDTVYVASDTRESQSGANNSISTSINYSLPTYIYSVNTSAVPPTSVAAGAVVATTTARNIIIDTVAYIYGITFSVGSLATTASFAVGNAVGASVYFDNCQIVLNNTATSSFLLIGNASQLSNAYFNNCTFKFNSTSQSIQTVSGKCTFSSCQVDNAGTIPTTLVSLCSSLTRFIGCDLSSFGSGKTILGAANSKADCQFINCKLGSAVTVAATPTVPMSNTYLTVSDSTNTTYQNQKYSYSGTLIPETTVVRTGGATNSITASSWKITTTATSSWAFPFETFPISIWNATTGSNVTVTVYGIWDDASVPTNAEIWTEATYLGSSSTPISSLVTTGKATLLSATTPLTGDSSTWGGSTTKFKMSLTFTPQMAGDIYVTIKCAKPSTTFYIDPQVVLS